MTHSHILRRPRLHLVVVNLLHISRVKRANLQGAILVTANYQQIFVSPLAERLSRSDKSIFRETDWNNGGDCTLNGFLLRCCERLSAASKSREGEREKCFISWAQRAKNTRHIMRKTLKTNILLALPERACVREQCRNETSLSSSTQASQPLNTLPIGVKVSQG